MLRRFESETLGFHPMPEGVLKFRESDIRSVSELLTKLSKHRPPDQPTWFRGQAKSTWTLVPSLARDPKRMASEMTMLKRFKQNAFLLLADRPATEWEWLFVMQHYGVPTRLLDWTESPLVSLYFAVHEKPKATGVLWAILPAELNREAGAPGRVADDIPSFDEDRVLLGGYLPSALSGESTSRLKTLALLAPRNTARSQAQHATFTIAHRDLTPIEKVGKKQHVWRYLIRSEHKSSIREELKRLNVTKLTLFPELVNVGEHAKGVRS